MRMYVPARMHCCGRLHTVYQAGIIAAAATWRDLTGRVPGDGAGDGGAIRCFIQRETLMCFDDHGAELPSTSAPLPSFRCDMRG